MSVASSPSVLKRLKAELEPLREPGAFPAQLLKTWRILVVVAILQVAFGLIGIYTRPFDEPFLCFWAGGVLASIPGVLLGIRWELADLERRSSSPRAIRVLYVLSAMGLSVMAIPILLLWTHAPP
jgi:hypothetical protein